MNSGTTRRELVKYLLGPQSEEPDEAAGSAQQQQDEHRRLLFRGCPVAPLEVCCVVLLVWATWVFDIIQSVNLLATQDRKMYLK